MPEDTSPSQLHKGADRLRADLDYRLQSSTVSFRLDVQRYEDERSTPIEDATVAWTTPAVPLASVTLTGNAVGVLDSSNETRAFSPWNHAEDFTPLGALTRSEGLFTRNASTYVKRCV